MRFVREQPWWKSRIDTTEREDVGCLLIGCVPEIGCPLFLIGLPIYGIVRLYQWIAGSLRSGR
ncbi:MAG TPA: hypothetical protein VM328_03400 [Fimbriimonadaceae bacterium]|nr:hypothetical protein [Fimbriimonadaceae bacterium]